MKNLIKSISLLAVAAMGLSACNEQNLTPEQVGKGELVTVHFGANSSIESPTKATLTTEDEKTFKSAWEDGDQLHVEYSNDGDSYTATTTPATWNGSSFETTMPSSEATDWYYTALYPAPTNMEVDFGSVRTQKGNAYNSKYDIMKGGNVAENAKPGEDDKGNPIVFEMDRLTGIVYFHLTGNLDEEVVSATFTATNGNIATGFATLDYSTGLYPDDTKYSDNITITFEEGTAPKAKDFQLWFNVLPDIYTSLSLHVETTGHTLDITRNAKSEDGEEFVAGKLYKTVATVPDVKWVAKAAEIPVYASLADLVAAGAPTKDGAQVTVTLTDEVIKTFNGTKGINILVGEQAIQLYCKSTAFPTEWTEGGTLSGILTNCEWVLYGGNIWELCPENWEELTYKAPENPIEIPVYASLAELVAAGKPTTVGEQVTVTLTYEEITGLAKSDKYTNGVFLKVGEQEIEIYCYDVPATWEVGGKISGTLTNCKWVLYKTTWELCPDSWDVFTYTAPLPTCATPVITIDESGAATITCETTGATIHYTVGESPADPTENDAVYSSAVTLTDGQTIKAIAIADGHKPSAIASKKYTVGGQESTVKTYRHVFDTKPSIGSKISLSNVNWDISATALNGYNSNNYAGVQFGTSKKEGQINLTSSSAWSYEVEGIVFTKIKEVRVWLNKGGGTVTPSVSIGGKTATSDGTIVAQNKDAKKDWTKTTKVTFTPATDGNTGVVVIDISSSKAGYICAIEIDAEN